MTLKLFKITFFGVKMSRLCRLLHNVMMDVIKLRYLKNRSAPAVNCRVINHCLEVSCKEDQITSAQRE